MVSDRITAETSWIFLFDWVYLLNLLGLALAVAPEGRRKAVPLPWTIEMI